ncbi:MAG: RNA-binding protein S1 [Mesoaciditoga sp.]|uniref:S1 RNA-binding domain-containing protein n=1 Tax=Athalassotoga TaxID=1769718 RepID=UPI000CBDD167|nr:S1 RNA-binding domain-containing protein [Athalassotoga saccharophila]PMP79319.1 MAG: RNA-binding protein S1 [Mesoaciditoga sp.]BBJ28248.1 general stress protein 13 [Athalassotoga saccharophila]HEU23768.1 S1 RNA-binding domain-containing protein [Mesoaciditoga lauensis]
MSVKTGEILEGTVTAIKNFGVFVKIEGEGEGLVHVSKIANGYVKDPGEYLSVGQKVKVKVLNVGENGKMDLSIKDAGEVIKKKDSSQPKEKEDKQSDFEQKMSKFLKESQQKSSDLKKRSDRYG